MKTKTKTKFEKLCEEVSDKTGVELFDVCETGRVKLDAFEDDECLHIDKRGLHACFSVGGGNYSPRQQNERTRAVLTALGLQKLITDRVLVEEPVECDDDNDGPHCGHSL